MGGRITILSKKEAKRQEDGDLTSCCQQEQSPDFWLYRCYFNQEFKWHEESFKKRKNAGFMCKT